MPPSAVLRSRRRLRLSSRRQRRHMQLGKSAKLEGITHCVICIIIYRLYMNIYISCCIYMFKLSLCWPTVWEDMFAHQHVPLGTSERINILNSKRNFTCYMVMSIRLAFQLSRDVFKGVIPDTLFSRYWSTTFTRFRH